MPPCQQELMKNLHIDTLAESPSQLIEANLSSLFYQASSYTRALGFSMLKTYSPSPHPASCLLAFQSPSHRSI